MSEEEVLYEDPETGELVPESAIDWSRYEVDKVEEVGEDWTIPFKRAGGEAVGGFLEGFGGAWGGGEQLIAENYPDLAEIIGADAEHGRRVVDAGQSLRSKWTDPYPIDTSTTGGYLTELAAKGAGGVGKLAPSFIGSALVPALAPALFGAQLGAETVGVNYDDARERGASPEDAQNLALIRGGVDAAAGAIIPGGTQASSFLRSLPKTALTLELGNTASAATRSATEQSIMEGGEIDLGRVASDTGEELLNTAPETLAMVPFFGAAGALSQMARRRTVNAAPEINTRPVVEAVIPPIDTTPVSDVPKSTKVDGPNQAVDFPEPVVKPQAEAEVAVPAKPLPPEPLLDTPLTQPDIVDPLTAKVEPKPGYYGVGDRIKEFTRSIVKAPEDISDVKETIKAKGGDPELLQYDHMASELEQMFNGRMFGREVPGAKNMAAGVRKAIILPWKMAKRDSNVMSMWRLNKDKMHFENELTFEFAQDAAPLFDLADQNEVNKVAKFAYEIRDSAQKAFDRGEKLEITPETYRAAGLSPEGEAAYKFGIRAPMLKAWKMVEEAVVENISRRPGLTAEQRAEKIANTRAYIREKEDTHYVPIQRFGENLVYGKNAEGKEWYSLHESKSAMRETAANLVAQGYETKLGDLRKTQNAFYKNMPPELRLDLAKLIEDPDYVPEISLGGYKAHLMRAEMVPGYEQDVKRNVAQYITSMSSWMGKLKYDGPIDSALARIDPKSPVYQEASDWNNYLKDNPDEVAWARSALGHYHLGFSPSSAILNLTQTLTTTWPQLRKFTNSPGKLLTQSVGLRRFYNKDPQKFQKQHPELYEALELAKRRGETSPQVAKNLMDMTAGKDVDLSTTPKPWNKKSWGELSMAMFSKAEEINRQVTLIAAMKAAPKGLDFNGKVQFAEDFITNSQFEYSRMGKPKIARGKLAPFYTFRLFGHNYFSVLGDALRDLKLTQADYSKARTSGDIANIKRAEESRRAAVGTLARYGAGQFAIGGGMALPFMSQLVSVLASQGVDVKKFVRDLSDWDKTESLLMYGPLHELLRPIGLGMNLTGAISPGEQLPFEKGFGGAAEKVLTGVVGDTLKRPFRAMTAYEQTGSLRQAAEEIVPRSVKNIMQGLEAGITGTHKSIYGDVLANNVTPLEAGLKMAGFNPARWAEEGEIYASGKIVDAKENAAREGLGSRYANAVEMILFGDKKSGREQLKELWEYSQSIGHEPQLGRILNAVKAKRDPRHRAKQRLAKGGSGRTELEEAFANFDFREEPE